MLRKGFCSHSNPSDFRALSRTSLAAVLGNTPVQLQVFRRCFGSLPPHTELTMPALSPTMTHGNLVKWLVKEGQEVAPGDELAEVETDKATLGWENQDEGFVAKLLVAEGAQGIAVGTPVALLVEEQGEVAAFKGLDTAAGVKAGTAGAAEEAPGEGAGEAGGGEAWDRIGPAARLLLETSGIARSAVRGTGPRGMVTKGDVLQAIASRGEAPAAKDTASPQAPEPKAEPEVQPLAAQAAAPPKQAQQALQQPDAVQRPPSPPPQQQRSAPAQSGTGGGVRRARRGSGPEYVDIPNSQVRKIIAQRLLESKRSIPHLYLSAEVELEGVAALREALKKEGTKVSVNDCVVKAVALALAEVPQANSQWDPATETPRPYPSVDVAVAVATPTGLLTPIIKAADTKSVVEISQQVRDLAARARANKLAPEEFQGGSFTISNLGMFGVDSFLAIINPPQACIMAVGGARQVPQLAAAGGTPSPPLATRTLMTVTLSADQRVYDGEVSSRFLDAFRRHMAAPFRMMS